MAGLILSTCHFLGIRHSSNAVTDKMVRNETCNVLLRRHDSNGRQPAWGPVSSMFGFRRHLLMIARVILPDSGVSPSPVRGAGGEGPECHKKQARDTIVETFTFLAK